MKHFVLAAADAVHDGKHTVSASAKLGAISAQKAGSPRASP